MADHSVCSSTRRGLLGLAAAALGAPGVIAGVAGGASSAMPPAPPCVALPPEAGPGGPEAALRRLLEGNARFLAGRNVRSAQTASGAPDDAPFAILLTCADSTLAPETMFDQGPGKLMALRVAGAVLDDSLLASIEYGVLRLGAPLVMVIGHEGCGAVTAAIDMLRAGAGDDDLRTTIPALAAAVAPAVDAARSPAGIVLETAIAGITRQTVRQILARSPLLRARAEAGAALIVAAHAGRHDGKVRLMDTHLPGQGDAQASPVRA